MSESPPSLLKVAEIHGRGRSLVTCQPIKAGRILLRESPILLYPSSCLSSSFCYHCFRSLDTSHTLQIPLSACPNCSVLFCSPACKSSALASSHSPWVCRSQALIPSLLSSDLHTQALFLVSAYNLQSFSPGFFQLLLALQGDPFLNSPALASEVQTLHSFICSLFPTSSSPFPEVALTAALLAKDKLNAFGLMEPFVAAAVERSVRAYAIYPTASLFNHDCLPNACRFDYIDASGSGNTDIIVRAIHDIDGGREVCLSYFPVNWSYADRQRRLLEDYGFVCSCDRCQVERNWIDDDNAGDTDAVDVDNDDHDQVLMDEDCGGTMEEDVDGGEACDDFPHAYFFARFMCQRENCGGTMAPLPPAEDGQGVESAIFECNVCGQLRKEEEASGEVDDCK